MKHIKDMFKEKIRPREYLIEEADIEDCNPAWGYSAKGADWECLVNNIIKMCV
jgi:hypothetical protein